MAYPTQISQSVLDYFKNHSGDTMAQYVDPQTGLQYFGRYDVVGQGEGNSPLNILKGYSVGNYNNDKGGNVGVYDTTGKYTGKDEKWSADDWNYDGLAMAAAGAFIGGFASLASGIGTTAAQAGETLSKAALDGTNVFGANSIPNALDISSLVNAAPGVEAANAVGNIAQDLGYFPPGEPYDPSTMPTEQDVLNPTETPPPATPGTPPTTTPPGTSYTTPPVTTPSNPSIPKVPPIPTPGGGNTQTGGNGGMDVATMLALLATGLYGANQQEHSSQAMLDYLKQRQAYNDNMYSQGSPELQALQQEMDRKDAAAGRNSQYGPRAVDLAGRIAQLKMNANTQMTTGIGNFMANALNQKANAGANLTSLLPSIIQAASSGGSFDLSKFITGLTNAVNGTGGTSTGGTTPPTNVDPNTVDTTPDNIDVGGGVNPETFNPQSATLPGATNPPAVNINANSGGNTGFVPTASGGSPVPAPAPAMAPQTAALPPAPTPAPLSQTIQSAPSSTIGAKVYDTPGGVHVQDYSGVPQASFGNDGTYTSAAGQTYSSDQVQGAKTAISGLGGAVEQYMAKYGSAPNMVQDQFLNKTNDQWGTTSQADIDEWLKNAAPKPLANTLSSVSNPVATTTLPKTTTAAPASSGIATWLQGL